MPTTIQANQIQNLQQIEAAVAGPDGANRLIIITGHIIINLTAFTPVTVRNEAFSALIGPGLTRQQFIRAIAIASVSTVSLSLGSLSTYGWAISGVDADRDDESGQVELRFELSASVTGQNSTVAVNEVDFQVTILAAVAT